MSQKSENTPAQRRATVALIDPVGGHSGMHYYDFGLCKGLIAAGCRVSLYTCDETENPAIPDLRFFPVYRQIFDGGLLGRAWRYIVGTFAAARKSTYTGESIWHFEVFNSVLRELLVILVAKLFRRKVILTVHDVSCLAGPQWGKRMLSRLTYQLADHLIVHNYISKCELKSIGVPAEMISVIRHGNYLDCVSQLPPRLEARQSLGIPNSAKVVLFFGQIKDVKGLDILIEAIPEVADEIPDVLLLIAGRPWRVDFSEFDSLIDRLNIRKFCQLHIGYIPDEGIAKFYAAADLVALPYRRIYQSGVLIMAMTYGKAVVVSDLPGMTEIVTDGVNGYVFPRGSSSNLAKTLIRALKNDSERQQVAQGASSYMQKRHDWGMIARQIADLYDSVLGCPRQSGEVINAHE